MNKNWNDRADKDLFFTILSVKNIGVISGSEWTTIGNHMRALGYGFTNEGCRQHFQGLRRAQNKAEANGLAASSSALKGDPTMNPITRRPGPGRGRPRKQPANGAPTTPGAAPAAPGATMVPPPHPAPGDVAMPSPVSGVHGLPDVSGLPVVPGPVHVPNMADAASVQGGELMPQIPTPVDGSVSAQGDTPAGDDLAVDPSLEDVEDEDEHAAKRPRLDDSQEPSLDDVAAMNLLAAHNNPTGDYEQDFSNFSGA